MFDLAQGFEGFEPLVAELNGVDQSQRNAVAQDRHVAIDGHAA